MSFKIMFTVCIVHNLMVIGFPYYEYHEDGIFEHYLDVSVFRYRPALLTTHVFISS